MFSILKSTNFIFQVPFVFHRVLDNVENALHTQHAGVYLRDGEHPLNVVKRQNQPGRYQGKVRRLYRKREKVVKIPF